MLKPLCLCLQGATKRCGGRTPAHSWWRMTPSWPSASSRPCSGSCTRCTAPPPAPPSDTSALEPFSGSSSLRTQTCWKTFWETTLCPGKRGPSFQQSVKCYAWEWKCKQDGFSESAAIFRSSLSWSDQQNDSQTGHWNSYDKSLNTTTLNMLD